MTLDPRTRAMLDAFRREETPSEQQLEQTLHALESELAASAVAPAAASSLSTAKLALLASATVAIVGASLWLRPRAEPVIVSPRAPVEEAPSNAPSFDEPNQAQAASPSTPAQAVEHARKRHRRGSDRGKASVEAAPTLAPPAIPESPPSVPIAQPPPSMAPRGIEAEMRLLDEAHRALHAGRFDAALRAIADYEREFPQGQLEVAAAVTRIEALCRAGRVEEGRVATRRFLAQNASSPFAARVRAACVPDPATR